MRQFVLALAAVAAIALPTLNAQQASPALTTPTRRTPKPSAAKVHASPQPTVHPTPGTKVGNGQATNNNRTDHNNSGSDYAEALRRYRHERHDQDWWKRQRVVIVLVGGGYYYWNAGYWCPAWGYDANYQRYDYDGPIYTYGNLLPDQVIVNVQHALKELGYYPGDVTGSLGVGTRTALSNYQADNGLAITGAVDEPTVRALGLI